MNPAHPHRPPARASTPGVRVVIPMFNAGTTVGDTLRSLLAQTHPRWHAIVVDDGSTDDGPEVVRRLARDDPRITLRQQANRGLADARNAGIDAPLAFPDEALVFLDADDGLTPTGLADLLDAMGDGPAGAGRHAFVDERGAGLSARSPVLPGLVGREELLTGNQWVPGAQIVRRSALGRLRFRAEHPGVEDYDLWLRLSDPAGPGVRWRTTPRTVAWYRLRPGSMSKNARGMLSAFAGALRDGAGTDDPSSGARVGRRRQTLLYAASAALLHEPGAGLDLLRPDAPGPWTPDEVGASAFWAMTYALCRPLGPRVRPALGPRAAPTHADPDHATLRDDLARLRAWLAALERLGGAPERSDVIDALAALCVDADGVSEAILARVPKDATLVLLGLGRNGRLMADGARSRGLRVVARDDALERGDLPPPAGVEVEPLSAPLADGAGRFVVVTPTDDAGILARVPIGAGVARWRAERDAQAERARERLHAGLKRESSAPARGG